MEISLKINDDTKAETILSLLKELPFVEIKIKNISKEKDISKSRKERLLSHAGSSNDMNNNEFNGLLIDFKRRRKV